VLWYVGSCAGRAWRRSVRGRFWRDGTKRSAGRRKSTVSQLAGYNNAWRNHAEHVKPDKPEFDESGLNEPEYLESNEPKLNESERNQPQRHESWDDSTERGQS
jgi:hypothetical protein